MELHHLKWLEYHPSKTADWLEGKLQEGFDIHHIDGNHTNNSRRNLVLIEKEDHLCMHDLLKFSSKISVKEIQKRGISKAKEEGKYRGRKPTYDRNTLATILQHFKDGTSMSQIAKITGIHRQSLYRIKNHPSNAEDALRQWTDEMIRKKPSKKPRDRREYLC